MRFKILFFITTVSFGIFSQVVYAQSLFSGMIFSEKKEGLKIVDVQSGSPGFEAGLRNGDIVVEIGGKKIKSLSDYIKISRELRNKKVEASLVILRKGVEYDATVRIYSIPIYQHWGEKVTKPVELPRDVTNTPYVYWVSKGYRTLKDTVANKPIDVKIANYQKALGYLLNALHYRPESLDAALQIAHAYHNLGSLYTEQGEVQRGVVNYRKSIRYYDGCYKKTDKEDYLNKILVNLQEIEDELRKIEPDRTKSALETKQQSLHIPQ